VAFNMDKGFKSNAYAEAHSAIAWERLNKKGKFISDLSLVKTQIECFKEKRGSRALL
jgi:hypothetical protein